MTITCLIDTTLSITQVGFSCVNAASHFTGKWRGSDVMLLLPCSGSESFLWHYYHWGTQ